METLAREESLNGRRKENSECKGLTMSDSFGIEALTHGRTINDDTNGKYAIEYTNEH